MWRLTIQFNSGFVLPFESTSQLLHSRDRIGSVKGLNRKGRAHLLRPFVKNKLNFRYFKFPQLSTTGYRIKRDNMLSTNSSQSPGGPKALPPTADILRTRNKKRDESIRRKVSSSVQSEQWPNSKIRLKYFSPSNLSLDKDSESYRSLRLR